MKKENPFTNDPLASCTKPTAANEQSRTVTQTGRLRESKVILKASQLVVRSERKQVALQAILRGKIKLAKGEWLNIYLDGKAPEVFFEKDNDDMKNLSKEPTNGKFPYKITFPARRLKTGWHTFYVIKGEESDRDGKKDKVIAKLRFRVVDCEPVRLVTSGRRQTQVKFAGPNTVAKTLTFSLPKSSVKAVRVGKTLLRFKKGKQVVTRNGLRIQRRGKVVKISGKRIALKSVVLTLAGRSSKGKYRALVVGQGYRLKLATAAKVKR